MLKQQYTDEQILNAVKSTPTGTRDVALEVGCSRKTASNRLEKLFEEGLINKYEVAAGGSIGIIKIWMRKEVE